MALFLERGFEATTIDDIATAADMSRRSFFHYFASKEDVVAAWQEDAAARWSQRSWRGPRAKPC